MNWELLHRINAVVIGVFVCAHLGVHLSAICSPDLHSQLLGEMRGLYASGLLEGLLVALVLLQVWSGYKELKVFVKPGWRLVRNLSGLYLLVFIVIHVGWVFYTRLVDHIATDFYWVAAAITSSSYGYTVLGFYGLGVFSFLVHMIAITALAWTRMPRRLIAALLALAVAVTALILLAFSGHFYTIEIPEYLADDFGDVAETASQVNLVSQFL